MEIDLVYLWVNGNDPEWIKKRAPFMLEKGLDDSMKGKGRFSDNQELKYSLRSAEKYAPWIRKIFIVTDNQVPEWLDTKNEKIRIVDHKEILPPEALPTFNSRIIEHNLHNIPGLSENFLYANDDMFFNREVKPSDFFLADGTPIIRFNRRYFRKLVLWYKDNIKKRKLSNYNQAIRNTSRLVEKRYGKYIGHKTHHNIDAYCKSDYKHTYEEFKNEIEATFSHRLRHDDDVQRNIYSYIPVIEKRAKVRFVSQKESFRCHIDNPGNFKKLEKCNPLLFCLNDSEYANDTHRDFVKVFLEKRFPEKSKFEK